MIRALVTLVIVGALGGGGYWFLTSRAASTGERVPTYVVARGKLVRRIPAEGNLRAVKATALNVPEHGEMTGMMKVAWIAPDGSRVKQGDVVVRFDPTEAQKQLRTGEENLASTTARLSAERIKAGVAVDARDTAATLAAKELEQTRKFASKDKQIYSRNQIIESEIDETLAGARKEHAEGAKQVERSLSRSKAALIAVEQQRARISIDHAKKALEAMEVRAPHDGLFVLLRGFRGDVPKLGDTMWPGQPIAELPLLETMEAQVFVLEVDGSGLAEGLAADVIVEARPDIVFEGKVKLVAKLAKPRNDGVPVQYFSVTVQLAKTDAAIMKPGARVRATLKLDESEALLVPRQAVFDKDGKAFAYRRTPHGDFESVPVELGAATSGRVVIKSGLAAGDAIALRDPTRSLDQALGSSASAAGGGDDVETTKGAEP